MTDKRTYNKNDDIDDAMLIEMSRRFFAGERVKDITQWLSQTVGRKVTRETFYPQLARAGREGLLRLEPSRHEELTRRIADEYAVDRDEIHVVDVGYEDIPNLVADAAARHVADLIDEVARKKERVHIGLGGGRTVNRVAASLARSLRQRFEIPPLTLHAMTPGFDVFHPRTAPIFSFGYFADLRPTVEEVGLFAPTAVPCGSYQEETSRPGIADSFEARKEVDIVITSCAHAGDKHGELNVFMEHAARDDGDQTEKALKEAGWIGDVGYRPYSEQGPIELEEGMRSVSLFEIEDLVRLAGDAPNKHVVLIATPCGVCGRTKAGALEPLLTRQDTLKLWNHLFLDTRTARALMPEAKG